MQYIRLVHNMLTAESSFSLPLAKGGKHPPMAWTNGPSSSSGNEWSTPSWQGKATWPDQPLWNAAGKGCWAPGNGPVRTFAMIFTHCRPVSVLKQRAAFLPPFWPGARSQQGTFEIRTPECRGQQRPSQKGSIATAVAKKKQFSCI